MSPMAEWLQGHGLVELAAVFEAQHVDLDILGDLTEADLRELGLTLGQRLRLGKALAARAAEGRPQRRTSVSPPPTLFRSAAETVLSPERDMPSERRHLTVVFCDLVGSTLLSDRLETEDYLEVIRTYRAFCTQIIGHYEGFVARFIGDGILCYFGYPIAHENDAERAVRAGLEIVRGLGAVANASRTKLEARIGITTGVVIIGDEHGAALPDRKEIVGATPNLAARIHAAAAPDEVLIAESTYRLVRGLFVCEALGSRMFKGFANPTALWKVSSERRVVTRFRASRGRRPSAPMVNREPELEVLRAAWHHSVLGEGKAVVIVGEAGIGKSRVVEHFAQGIEGGEAFVQRYNAGPFTTQSPLSPLIAFVTRAAHIRRTDDVPTRVRRLEGILRGSETERREALAILADLLALPLGGVPPLDLTPSQIRERTFALVLDQFERLAEVAPLLLIVEDLHWLDPTSFDLLDRIIPRLRDRRVLLLITCRDGEQEEWIAQSGLEVLRQGRLSPEHSQAIVRNVLGERHLDPAFQAQIVSKTDGIPLFLEEFTSTVVDAVESARGLDRFATPAMPRIPESLHEILVARLDQAGEAKILAQTGSVLGRSFQRVLLDAVVGKTPSDTDANLNTLVGAGLLLEEDVDGQAHYTFKHALVQDAAYRTLLRERRRQLHALVANALETLMPEVIAEQPELMARHLTAADLPERAVGHWIHAAERSLHRSALREAAAQLRRGLEVLDALPEAPRNLEQRLRILTLLGPALISLNGPGSSEVEDVYVSAYETTRKLPESRSHFPVFWGWWRMSRDYNDKTKRFEALLHRAQVRADPELQLQAHHCGWGSHFGLGNFKICCEHIDRGLAIYEAGDYRSHATLYGNHDAKVCGHGERALVYWLQGLPEQAEAEERKAMAWAGDLNHDGSSSHAIDIAVMHSAYRRDLPDVVERANTMLRLAEAKGFADHQSKGHIFLGWTVALQGDATAGLRLLRSGLARQKDNGTVEDFPIYFSLLADALQLAGRPGEALEELEAVLAVCRAAGLRIWIPEVLRRIGELRILAGAGPTQAEAAMREGLDMAIEQGARALSVRGAISLARFRAGLGDRDGALDLLAPYAGGPPEWLRKADVGTAQQLAATLLAGDDLADAVAPGILASGIAG